MVLFTTRFSEARVFDIIMKQILKYSACVLLVETSDFLFNKYIYGVGEIINSPKIKVILDLLLEKF